MMVPLMQHSLSKHLLLAAGLSLFLVNSVQANSKSNIDVLEHYADIALASFKDSHSTAKELLLSIKVLIEKPTSAHLTQARLAWVAARVPYQQTEVFRFGNSIVDDWEGKVNAWPLDEGLIDYVDASFGGSTTDNPLRAANVVANQSLKFGGRVLDASNITAEFIANELHEADGIEANVATGYHAIEFLLWGQDLNGTEAGAGNRPASDFDTNNCTNKNCDRRSEYLMVAATLLVDDLAWMAKQWQKNGAARRSLLEDESQGLAAIVTGMGSLSYGELAGERMKLGLLLNDPEEEHDCFSDNTHNSHFYNIKSIQNVYLGRYESVSGDTLSGPSLSSIVAMKNSKLNQEIQKKLDTSIRRAKILVDSAENTGVAYDQLLASENKEGNNKITAVIDALLSQTIAIEKVSELLGLSSIEFEGSDSLDSPDAVFK